MKHGIPKIIYLQICEDPDCDVPYDDHDGITWCDHKINKTDVKYVLAKDKLKHKKLTNEQKYMLIEKYLGLKKRRDETVIDQYTGLFYAVKPYFDLIDEALKEKSA